VEEPEGADPEHPDGRAEHSSASDSQGSEVHPDEAAPLVFLISDVAEARFDDPAQPAPRSGGLGWIRVLLPAGLYINLYRAEGQRIGAQVRFSGAEGEGAYAELLTDRAAIDAEIAEAGLETPEWRSQGTPVLSVVAASPQPWDHEREAEQRAWFARAANQFINSLRPRLQRYADH
jgi:hypothetical protein